MSNPWHPIETVPKDGSIVLLWHKLHKCPIAAFYKPEPHLSWYERTLTTQWPTRAFSHWAAIVAPEVEDYE